MLNIYMVSRTQSLFIFSFWNKVCSNNLIVKFSHNPKIFVLSNSLYFLPQLRALHSVETQKMKVTMPSGKQYSGQGRRPTCIESVAHKREFVCHVSPFPVPPITVCCHDKKPCAGPAFMSDKRIRSGWPLATSPTGEQNRPSAEHSAA
jgi:hypothetical protein